MKSIRVTGLRQKQAWVDREMPPIEQVSPHVWSVPVSAGRFPIRYTLCYLLFNDAGDVVVVDPGLDSAEGWAQLMEALSRAGTALGRVIGVAVTHHHLDHVGMAPRLAEAAGAWFAMSDVEAHLLRGDDTIDEVIRAERAWLRDLGVPEDTAEEIIADSDGIFEQLSRWGRPTITLSDGDDVPFPGRTVRAVLTPGHTPGHLCLVDLDERLVLSGDHILPRISPNVSKDWTQAHREPLNDYRRSLARMREWDDFEVCPAHEYRFRGLDARIHTLEQGIGERAAEVDRERTMHPEFSVWQVAEQLTWSRGWSGIHGANLRGALAETVAHLDALHGPESRS